MSSNPNLNQIQEVVECGMRKANYYLDRHYVLLEIQSSARSAVHPAREGGGPNTGQVYTRRAPVFIIGRPPDVEKVTPPDNI